MKAKKTTNEDCASRFLKIRSKNNTSWAFFAIPAPIHVETESRPFSPTTVKGFSLQYYVDNALDELVHLCTMD